LILWFWNWCCTNPGLQAGERQQAGPKGFNQNPGGNTGVQRLLYRHVSEPGWQLTITVKFDTVDIVVLESVLYSILLILWPWSWRSTNPGLQAGEQQQAGPKGFSQNPGGNTCVQRLLYRHVSEPGWQLTITVKFDTVDIVVLESVLYSILLILWPWSWRSTNPGLQAGERQQACPKGFSQNMGMRY